MNIALLQRAILFALAFGLGIAFALLIHPAKANAKNYQQVICEDEPNPEECQKIHFWYLSARSNDRTSCCGIADAYWADKTVKVIQQGVFFQITDRRDCEYAGLQPRIEEDAEGNYQTIYDGQPCITGRIPRDGSEVFVPRDALDKRGQGNPTGHVVLFISAAAVSNYLDNGTMYPSIICAFLGAGG